MLKWLLCKYQNTSSRGKKNAGPRTFTNYIGEIGWAIDTRELFIGNGSVAEGPPVGNTKVLTQYDDLFSLADTILTKKMKVIL